MKRQYLYYQELKISEEEFGEGIHLSFIFIYETVLKL